MRVTYRKLDEILVVPSRTLGRNVKNETIIVYITLTIVVLFCIVSVNYRTIALPWFTMTEEFPYAQEVLRFLSGDFRQHFFDIPGTPFIAIVTALDASILLVVSLVTGQTRALAALAFEHLDLLYLVMRCVSLVAFAAATWLVFLIARRFASPWAALFGAAVFASHPILAMTIYHTRIEPVGVLIVSASILAWLRAVETRRWSLYAAAGFLGGLAMAARFPLALATLPVLVFYTLARPDQFTGRGNLVDRWLAAGLLGAALFGGGLAALRVGGLIQRSRLTDLFFLSIHHGGYPRATRVIANLWILLGVIGLGVLVIAAMRSGRRLIARYLHSSLLTVVVFFPMGVLVGVPTLFAGANYLLASIEMFVQRNAYTQPNVGRGTWNVLSYYLFGGGGLTVLVDPRPFLDPRHFLAREAGVLFTIPLAVLFCCGLLGRPANRWLYWSAILGCVVGVGSQFGKLHTPRHLAGWLPWFCLVIAVGGDWLARRTAASRRSIVPLFAMCLTLILWQREVFTAPLVDDLVEKAKLQTELNRWLRANVSPDDQVFHTCCEPISASVVFGWMVSNGVAVPEKYLEDGSTIWFGQLSVLRAAGEGYVITSRHTYPDEYLNYYRQMNPAELVDPYRDPRFARRHTIAAKNIYDIFYFVMDGVARPASGGISVREATYGQSCAGVAVPAGWINTVRLGNLTRALARTCNRREVCTLTISSQVFGDPAPFCAKDFKVKWACPDGRSEQLSVPAEAHGKTISLRCEASRDRAG
jgi:hypothetical protein